MFQVTASTFIGDAESLRSLVRSLGSDMAQFVGANFMVLPRPISTEELAAAIVATPAGQAQIQAAVDRAVGKKLTRRRGTRNA